MPNQRIAGSSRGISKVFIAAGLLCLVSLATPATTCAAIHSADHGPLGVGLILGEPSGLSANYWLQTDRSVDLGLAFSFINYFLIYSDYLFHFPGAFGHSSPFVAGLTPYVGIGGELFFSTTTSGFSTNRYFSSSGSSVGIGVRIPLGVEFILGAPPFGFYVEITPGIGIVPAVFGFVQGGIGARYYF